MNDGPTEFSRLMESVRSGCPEAARALFERYGSHVRRVVRRKLHQRLRALYDSTDFTQAVWGSFFTTPAERFGFDTPEALVSFLAGMAFRKVAEAYRKRVGTKKRDTRRERPLLTADGDAGKTPRDPRQPTPSQVAVANEEWERLLKGQPAQYRLVLEMLRRGHTHAEAAARVGLNPKSIQRLLQKLNHDPAHHE
jgi:RNA polymerase sigma factor (sigma-70 family)